MSCGKLPDPTQRKDGFAYIPISDTAFLIPEKTWIKGYSRNATDGLVSAIALHATIPDVQPWSPQRHDEMYWHAGPGKKLVIRIEGGKAHQVENFHNIPRSIRPNAEFIEELSDQANQGLRRFRQLRIYKPEPAELDRHRKKWGDEQVNRLLAKSGTPDMSEVVYELIDQERVKYLIRCKDDSGGLFKSCHLKFPFSRSLMVDVYFIRDHIHNIVSMADKLNDRLREFESAGLAYQDTLRIQSQPSRQ